MNTHQGYIGGPDGAKCTRCGRWVPDADDCVLLEPATVTERGSVFPNATTIHGVLCMGCYDEL